MKTPCGCPETVAVEDDTKTIEPPVRGTVAELPQTITVEEPDLLPGDMLFEWDAQGHRQPRRICELVVAVSDAHIFVYSATDGLQSFGRRQNVYYTVMLPRL